MKKIKFIKLFLSDLGVSLPKGEYHSIFHYCITFTLLLFMFSTTIFEIYAQSGRAKSLELGNRWIHERINSFQESHFIFREVIGDTTINNKNYAIIKLTNSHSPFTKNFYERADNDKIYGYSSQYNDEGIIMDFSLNIGDSLRGYFIYNKYKYLLWGDSLRTIHMSFSELEIWENVVYTEKLGFIMKETEGIAIEDYEVNLVSAQIEGKIYGDSLLLNTNEKKYIIEKNFHLSQNYPNPFNPVTKIKFTIPAVGTRDRVFVQLKVYDVLGNEVATLVNGYKPAGSYEVEFSVEAIQRIALTSGVYFYQLKAGNYIETKKMVVLK